MWQHLDEIAHLEGVERSALGAMLAAYDEHVVCCVAPAEEPAYAPA